MKKTSLLVAALIGCLAVGTVAIAVAKPKKTKKVNSKVSLSVAVTPAIPPTPPTPPIPPDPYDPYDPGTPGTPGTPGSAGSGTFSGKVKAKKAGKCKKKRKVTVKSQTTGERVGKARTARDGTYEIDVAAAPAAGAYKTKVKKKTINKKNKKIVCRPNTSDPFSVA